MVIHGILSAYGIYHSQLTVIFFLPKKKKKKKTNHDILTHWADYWWTLELKFGRVETFFFFFETEESRL